MAPKSNASTSVMRQALTLRPSFGRDVAIGLGTAAVCTAIRLMLTRWLGYEGIFFLHFGGIMVAGVIAGTRAMLISLVASSLIVWWAFIPPMGFRLDTREEIDALVTFTVAAALIGGAAAYVRLTLIRLWDAEDRLQLQANELSHRVKNALSTAIAVATMTAPKSDAMKVFLANYAARLHAIGRTSDLLARNAWTTIDVSSLLELELGPFGEKITIQGPPLQVQATCASCLSMIVHELATNAMKYGALSGEGHVEVTWRTLDGPNGDHVILNWIETGTPATAGSAQSFTGGGFGSKLITRIAERHLKGSARLDFHPGGLHAEIDFPALAAA